jgi:hypothetical protein
LIDKSPWAAVVQAVASIVGFFVLFYQVLQLRNNIRGATHDRLYAHYNDVCKELSKNPTMYPYFYDKKPVNIDSAPNEVKLVSEMIWGVIEHSKVQERNLPLDSWANCWLPYALERINKSPVVKEYFEKNCQWYTPATWSVFEEFKRYEKDGEKQYYLKLNSRKVSKVAMRWTFWVALTTVAIFVLSMMTLGSKSFMCGV